MDKEVNRDKNAKPPKIIYVGFFVAQSVPKVHLNVYMHF